MLKRGGYGKLRQETEVGKFNLYQKNLDALPDAPASHGLFSGLSLCPHDEHRYSF
jgi:hypothetical protein